MHRRRHGHLHHRGGDLATLKVIGAGVGRTGTHSLKSALERLLGGPCYHMVEVFSHPDHVASWHAAARDEPVDWHQLLDGYSAAVDWPASAFWPELSEAFPDAIVLLSTRPPESWWESASSTIFPSSQQVPNGGRRAMLDDLFAARFTSKIDDREASIAAFERHNARVRETVSAERLVEWQPGDGWEPLGRALDVPVPDEPYPHTNTRADWAQRGPPVRRA